MTITTKITIATHSLQLIYRPMQYRATNRISLLIRQQTARISRSFIVLYQPANRQQQKSLVYLQSYILPMVPNTLSQAITSITFTIPHTYGYVIIVAALLAVQLILFQFLFADRIRRKIFSKDWMLKHFGQVHNREVGKDVPINQNGFPDTGSGVYSQKLTYKEWFDLNNAQRVHYNFLEMAPSIFVCLLLAGLYYPIQAVVIGLVIAVSRLFQGIGYMTYGPKGRTLGAFGSDVCLVGLFYFAGMTGWKVAKGQSV